MGSRVRGMVAVAVALVLGATVTGAQAAPMGQIFSGETRSGTLSLNPPTNPSDVWSFAYTAGDVVIMKGAHPNPSNRKVSVEIRDANNVVQPGAGVGCGSNGAASFTLPATGTYTAIVTSCYNQYIGGYFFTFVDVTAGPLRVTGDPQAEGGVITSAQTIQGFTTEGDLDVFQVRADPGERLVAAMTKLGSGPNPLLWLLPPSTAPSPAGNLFTGLGDRQEVALAYAGIYTIVAQSEDSNKSGTFNLTVQKIPGASADCYSAMPDPDGGIIPAAPTASVNGNIAWQSGLDAWQFHATAAQTATVTLNREMRVSLYAPTAQRQFGAPVYAYAVCNPLLPQTTHAVPLTATGYYELLIEECTVAGSGTYTLGLTLPAETAPPPLAVTAPAACGDVTNVFDPASLGWAALPSGLSYDVYVQQWPLAPAQLAGTVAQPPVGDPVFPIPYRTLPTGSIYSWYVDAWDGFTHTYSPTYSFGLFCTPAVSITPATLDFGDVIVGQSAAPVTVTITNTGTCTEDPRVLSVPAGFTVGADTCSGAPAGGHLAPAGSCSFQVGFTPDSHGPFAGGLVLDGLLPEAHGGVIDLAGRGVLPDLRVASVSDPAPPAGGVYVVATDTTENAGDGPAPGSNLTFLFSLDTVVDAGDLAPVSGSRATPPLAPAATSTATTNLYLPGTIPSGAWHIGVCVDNAGLVTESDETNNCTFSAGTFQIGRDISIAEVTDAPVLNPDGTFSFTETTRNLGTLALPATVTGYRLSLDQKVTRLDPVLAATRAVPALTAYPDAAHVSTATLTLAIPADTPRGSYYVAACADVTNVVGESSETNNCRLSKNPILIEADLSVTAVSEPPASPFVGSAGATFSITDTTVNTGVNAAPASGTRYRLSLDATITASDTLLTGTRAVPALGVGASSTGTVTVTIPATAPAGDFYLGACADDAKTIPEKAEDNNCRVSTTRVTIARADMTVTAVGDPPLTGVAGTTFSVSDSTRNAGTVTSLPTETYFRLSADNIINAGDTLLTGTRAVPALAAGATSASATPTTLTIPATLPPGQYYLGACADGKGSVAEVSETNNCRAAAGRITLGAPDLQATAVTAPPAFATAGDSFSVTDTTLNASATVGAFASATRYHFSIDDAFSATDPLLTGSRAVPALAAGENSSGTVTVSIPVSLPAGVYYLLACADDGSLLAETNENNNCRASATTVNMRNPDLTVTAVSNPPAAGLVGDTFPVDDTVLNQGAVPAGASATRFRLSLDAVVNGGDPLLTGSRAVPALAPGASSAGTGTVVTIPAALAQGTYYLGACADDSSLVPETSETNNCRASGTTITISKPDLRVTAVSEPPIEIDPGGSFEITDTTTNSGTVAAAASATRYRLSLDTAVTASDPLLTGSRAVPGLAAAGVSTGTVSVSIPTNIVQGSYYLGACADVGDAVPESNENNNCAVSTTTLDVLNADLRVAAVGNPPAEGFVGTIFSATDTTWNAGAAATTAATLTRFRLSLDTTITAADPLLSESPITAQHRIVSLAPGETSQGTVNVAVPATLAQGTYYLAACADTANTVTESNETNNCRIAATTFEMKKPDLRASTVTNPPADGFFGTSFPVTDTTVNGGLAAAAASTTRYRLSTDTAITATDPLLTGTRAVGALAVGASSADAVTVTIPAGIAQGIYYLGACADDQGAVPESNETNNCVASATTINLKLPDLRISAVTNPPATGTVGTSFDVTDTTENVGVAAAIASTTRYRLSTDDTVTSADPQLTGTRDAGALGPGATSSGTVSVTIPGAVVPGTYYLAACADDAAAVPESDEANNCRVSATTITFRKSDLQISTLTNPPAGGVVGMSFPVTDTTVNAGLAAAGASVTQYRLSIDTTINGADPLLTGTRAVPGLAVGADSNASATVTIPATILQGTYYLGACADGAMAVAESDEANNCRASTTTISLAKADLQVTAVSDPPAEGTIGATVTITDTTENLGTTGAAASTTRYRLSADRTITTADTAFTASRAVPALGTGAASTGSATLVIPTVAQGLYYVGACADEGAVVPESVETNNCLASDAQIWVKRPDLAVTAVSDPPAEGFTGSSFSVTDTTGNIGLAAAAASTTRYRLSLDAIISSADPLLTGTRAAGALGIGGSSTGTVTVTIPASVAQGTYRLAACADDTNLVAESLETNNCQIASTTIDLKKPDLWVTAVGSPPLTAVVGASFVVDDTTENRVTAQATAGASTTRFRLSLDTDITAADPQLTGQRSLAALAVGEASSGSTTLTVPGTVPQGTYYLAACADDLSVVSESDEANNCRVASGLLQIQKPDLLATGVTEPPASGIVGTSFDVMDTTENADTALAAAGASTTRYRLSLDRTINGSDPLLTGARAVVGLAVGEASSGTVTVTIPGTVLQGTYYLGACADDASAVSESDETNNCVASTGTIELRKPDLQVSAVSDPPAEGVAGDVLSITDTTLNSAGALADAAASATRYRLSLDSTISASDILLTGSRAVGALAVGAASTGPASVTIPSTIAEGTYFLGACADDAGLVAESNETNNCRVASGQILVKRADLTVTSISEPPAQSLPGGTFTVDDTVRNVGLTATTVASTTRYRLSLDPTITTTDPLLTGTRTVGALAVATSSPGSGTTVTVPTNIAGGYYYLGACADATSVVPESNEANNCLASTGTVNLWKPDLAVTAFSLDPPPADPLAPVAVTAGWGSFDVAETTRNISTQRGAAASTTRYYLSLDATVTTADTRLAQTHAVPALALQEASSVAPLALSVAATVADGTYRLFACADDTLTVLEVSEANCVQATNPVAVVKPDLVYALAAPADTALDPGQSTTVSGSVTNAGAGHAGPATTRFFLSTDAVITAADLLLAGTLVSPDLAAGAADLAPATVTVPSGTLPGTYYLAGCADDLQTVTESDETNNCGVWAGSFVVHGADLRATAVSDPPATAYVGEGFTIDDTTVNEGLVGAGASTTSYYLSTDTVYQAGDRQLSGSRAVPALAAGAQSVGGGTAVSIPLVSTGVSYHVIACADAGGAVPEFDETDNCVASTGTVQVLAARPELEVTSLSEPPTAWINTGSFTVTDTTRNNSLFGATGAGSTTRYYLSLDLSIGAEDYLVGSRSVPALQPLMPSTGSFTVAITGAVPQNYYYLAACADDTGVLAEGDETNNCRFSTGRLDVRRPDIQVHALVTNLGSYESPGLWFWTNVTVHSFGWIAAPASTTRFLFSTDMVVDAGDILLEGSQAVPALPAITGSFTSEVYVDIPITVPPGQYYLAACADYANEFPEQFDTYNCLFETYPTLIRLADLLVTDVSGFPATAFADGAFSVTDTTVNSASGNGNTFQNAYYLSADAVLDAGDTLLAGGRTILEEFFGSNTNVATVTVPAGLAPGHYYVGVCADGGNTVPELSEANNCLVSATTIEVLPPAPDLQVSAVTNPPGTVNANGSFNVTDTTRNAGALVAAPASTTTYHFSLDATISAGDHLLTGSRAVPALNPGATSSATVSVTVPMTVPGGIYYLIACADGAGAVTETNETNNCRASTSRVTLSSRADLVNSFEGVVIQALLPYSPGMTFPVDNRTDNIGNASALATVTRFRFSTDTTIAAPDPLLTGTIAVPLLVSGGSHQGTATLTVPVMPEGYYYLGACSDTNSVVTELTEANNCSYYPSLLAVRWAELAVTAITAYPSVVTRGTAFSVTDTVTNTAFEGVASAFTVGYRLSADATVTFADTAITGSRAITVLGPGVSDTGTATVTVPAGTAPGTYYLGVCADPTDVVPEAETNDNCLAAATTIQVQ